MTETMIRANKLNIESHEMKGPQKVQECSRADRKTGLCRLLIIQMMFGITYGGNCPYFNNYPLKKAVLILYDLIVIISFGLFEYFAFNGDVFSRLYQNSTNKGVVCILFKFAAFSLAFEFVAIKLMLLKNGWTIIHALKRSGLMRVTNWQFRSVILFLGVMALAFALLFPINFTDLNKSLSEISSGEGVKTIGFFFVGVFYSMNKFSITSTLLFSALSLKGKLEEWREDLKTCNIKIQTLCESILELRIRLEEINSQIGLLMFIKIFINAMLIPAALCSLYLGGSLPFNAIVGVCLFAITSLVDIFVLCHSSQIMIDSMSDLCKEVESMLIMKAFDDTIHKQLFVILAMKKHIRVKVLCMFDLKTVTLLAIMGYVTNYAIILIQTTFSEK